MTRRFLLLSFAVGLLALGGSNAQAGQISISPSGASLSDFTTPPANENPPVGSYAIVGNLEFSNFTYVPTPVGSPPAASAVTVSSFTSVPSEPGITFNGVFTAAAGSTVDYAISYSVTTTDGTLITDAYLSLGGPAFTGTGTVSIGESILNSQGTVISTIPFAVFIPGQSFDTTALFPPESTIIVQKDIAVNGGSNGATFSFVNQGFSTIPEPASMALLGIGLSGLFTLRRFLKRTSVA